MASVIYVEGCVVEMAMAMVNHGQRPATNARPQQDGRIDRALQADQRLRLNPVPVPHRVRPTRSFVDQHHDVSGQDVQYI